MAAVYVNNLVINSGSDFSQSFTLEGTNNSPFNLTGYEVDALSIGIEHDLAGADEFDVTTLSLGYAMDGLSLGLEVATDDSWEVSASTTSGAITAGIVVMNDDAYEVTGSYDLGGGASVLAGMNDADTWYLGTALKF